ncbi:type II toxin-antitoxin system RelE/ParE family toxin [Burkholderia sp. 22PA0106]
MKTYELRFLASALNEWTTLDTAVRAQFRRKLAERLDAPHVPAARLSGLDHCYKINLPALGYRLAYQVDDNVVTVTVVSVGKRARSAAYVAALTRLK